MRNVAQIVCLWQPAQGQGVDNLPTRGFAGQILFMAHNESRPVPVHGDVRIYLFDEHAPESEQGKPIHQFDFPAKVWDLHRRESKLGTVYHVFIPYSRKGMHRAECSLNVRFQASKGPALFSELVDVTLAGRDEEQPKVEIDKREVEPSERTIELLPSQFQDTGAGIAHGRNSLQSFSVPSRSQSRNRASTNHLHVDQTKSISLSDSATVSDADSQAATPGSAGSAPKGFKLRLKPAVPAADETGK